MHLSKSGKKVNTTLRGSLDEDFLPSSQGLTARVGEEPAISHLIRQKEDLPPSKTPKRLDLPPLPSASPAAVEEGEKKKKIILILIKSPSPDRDPGGDQRYTSLLKILLKFFKSVIRSSRES